MMKRTVIASCALVLMTTLASANADAKLRNPFKKGEESSESQGEDKGKSKGDTQSVKGLNGKEGEIVGTPAANSPFKKVQIGMTSKQVFDLIGSPTDTGSFRTGKGYIPYYHGGDTWREESVYKGVGRLIFASSSPNTTANYLIKIVHDSKEEGYYK